jgi:hypothetical protein
VGRGIGKLRGGRSRGGAPSRARLAADFWVICVGAAGGSGRIQFKLQFNSAPALAPAGRCSSRASELSFARSPLSAPGFGASASGE